MHKTNYWQKRQSLSQLLTEILSELPFRKSFIEKQSIAKYSRTFKNYTHSFTIEELDFRDPEIQLNITKPHVKILLKYFLAEMRGFKCQITLKIFFVKK